MKRRTLFIAGVVLAVLALGGLFFATVVWEEYQARQKDVPAPMQVPADFGNVAGSEGHQGHLGETELKCDDCHALKTAGFSAEAVKPCTSCHDDTHATLHEQGALSVPACLDCHRFGVDETIGRDQCQRCHAAQHPEAPAPHRALVENAPAVVRHGDETCAACHRAHDEPSLEVASCQECHEEADTHPASEGHESTCLGCHTAHGDAVVEKACADCHTEPLFSSAVFEGHDECASCHKPHAFGKRAANQCVDCHRGQPALASVSVPEHRDCTGCHNPHAPKRADERACVRCHTDVARTNEHTAEGNCLACHAAHPSRGARSAKLFSAASVHASGASDCRSCHNDVSEHNRETACVDCHRPHDFVRALGRDTCATCHTTQARLTEHNAGHQDCASCHRNSHHDAKAAVVRCADCHRTEWMTAPPGHTSCMNCHEQHRGTLKAKTACSDCHAEEASTVHGQLDRTCSSCHRPHGPDGPPQPPACATCHTTGEHVPRGLHRREGHENCASCHATHDRQVAVPRESCLSSGCHSDRKNHEPSAQVCTGCHMFTD